MASRHKRSHHIRSIPQVKRRFILRAAVILCSIAAVPSCKSKQASEPPRIEELELGSKVKSSGKKLMALAHGMHRLHAKTKANDTAIIAVHGYGSRGYEWVYPLHQFAKANARVFFYRWDWQVCPDIGAQTLSSHLNKILGEEPNLDRIRIFGHSYGGVIAALAGANYRGSVPLELNLIAAPLAGMSRLATNCDFKGFTLAQPNPPTTWFEWRTQHRLDGAFKSLENDPQNVSISGSKVVRLPETYRNHRLGHNWSISWVSEQPDNLSPAFPIPKKRVQ